MKHLLLLCFAFVSFFANAQDNNSDSVTRVFYFGIGYQYQSFKGLSNRIGSFAQYEKPGSNFANITLGRSSQYKNLILDYNLHFASALTGDDEKANTSLMNAGIGVNIGYNFSKSRKIRVYPFAGVTAEFYRSAFSRDVSGISFDSILVSNSVQQRTEPAVFTNNFFCYQGGVAVDFLKFYNRFLSTVSLRVSYTGSFKSRTWRVNENQLIANAPTDKISQLNASILFGIGRRTSGRMMKE